MFENNIDKDNCIENKIGNLSLKDNFNQYKCKDIVSSSDIGSTTSAVKKEDTIIESTDGLINVNDERLLEKENKVLKQATPEIVYKSNIEKFNFLQTQLSGDSNFHNDSKEMNISDLSAREDNLTEQKQKNDTNYLNEIQNNITDDSRLAQSNFKLEDSITNLDESVPNEKDRDLDKLPQHEENIKINVPPRRKKMSTDKKAVIPSKIKLTKEDKEYPDHLNPFSDDEEEVYIL